ncbi:Aminodeoxychorismate synthase, chloroplastic [Smittium culicis]|uniref:Aminodeoxychorismate synthase, chloroplastic n=1 Tax=Smittium culicis TaxID=133412 RepID=A0A1R1WYU7_9FUNG|nr:Aminodeoxychorismate synthase, chloroplastic [Smittium culicis]
MNPNVSKLINLESYSTVYQLVSTIESSIELCDYKDENPTLGKNRNDTYTRKCPLVMKTMANCFPPGSMTGAPKIRSVEILANNLETSTKTKTKSKRGIYSGCIGYISAFKAQMNWSVVIRTIISKKNRSLGVAPISQFEIGAGGAITILSDPESEWNEAITKLDSVLYG